jgi:serine/threonine protein kinase
MFSLQSGLEGWFTGAACRAGRPRGCGGAGWGTCIDISPFGAGSGRCDDELRHGMGQMKEFRDRDIIVDEHGLHVLGRGGRDGYGHILVSAQKASAFGRVSSTDALSEASTHNELDQIENKERENFMRSVSPNSWRSTEGWAPTGKRPRASVSLSGLGIKRFNRNTSPKSVPQAPHANVLGVGKLSLGEVAQLPMLTDAPVSRNKSFNVPQSSMHKSSSRKMDVKLADLHMVKLIGKGNSGTVWQATLQQSGTPLAVKQMTLSSDSVRSSMAVRELVTMYGLDHVCIVGCHNVFYCKNAFHLVMELMDGGSLLDAMERCYTLNAAHTVPPAALATIAVDVLGALEFLHDELRVIHRDVKPGNILLSTSGRAKLGDLGIVTEPGVVQVDPRARRSFSSGLGTLGTLEPVCSPDATEWIGTMTYMSPERLSGDCYSFSADIWSLGLVLVEAALGFYPIGALPSAATPGDKAEAKSLQFWDLHDLVQNGACPSRLLASRGAQWASLQSLATACLTKDGSKRPCAQDLLLRKCEVAHSTSGHFVDKAHAPALAAWVRCSLAPDAVLAEDAMHVEAEGASLHMEEASRLPRQRSRGGLGVMHDNFQGLVDEEGSEADGWL